MLNFIKKIFKTKTDMPLNTNQNIQKMTTSKANEKVTIFEKAFYGVMKNIIGLSREDKRQMCSDFMDAHQSGNPANEKQVCMEWLYAKEWDWPWFNEWEKRFQQSNEYPCMWKKIQDYLKAPATPENIEDSLVFMTVSDMRNYLKKNNISVRPAPKKRVEFEAALRKHGSMDHLKDMVKAKIEKLKFEYNEKIIKWKIELLAHTITMSFYSLRNQMQRSSIMAGMKERGKILKISSGGCKVEDKIAKRGLKKNKFPPFFPGDRSSLIFKDSR